MPLVRAQNYALYHAGGLLFANFELEEEFVTVLPPSTDLRHILEGRPRDLSCRVPLDAVGRHWRRASHVMWQWECRILGRNRWDEMRQRGGDVAPSLIDSIPRQWPLAWLGVYKTHI